MRNVYSRGRAVWPWVPALLGIAITLGIVLAARANAGTATIPADAATQQRAGGQVTVAVTWPGRAAGLVFRVALDTHAVDLDGYDLRQLAVLRTEQGVEVRPSGWDAPPGGHHRAGTLAFPATTPDGQPVLRADTRSLELVIRDVAGVPERTYRWTP
jgi:hypothetical protein